MKEWPSSVKVDHMTTAVPECSPAAYVFGEDWDERMPLSQAKALGLLFLSPQEAERADRAWRGEIARRLKTTAPKAS
jgi:hypothetical protein